MLAEEGGAGDAVAFDFLALDIAGADEIVRHLGRTGALRGKRGGGGQEGDGQ
jgi:hypothetical protein